MPKSFYQEWLEEKETDLRDEWESMGMVERHEEGGTYENYCKSRYETDPDVCADCGSISGGCFHCKMD